MTNSLAEARRFLRLAADDTAAFQALCALPHIRSALAYFHAQQAMEKNLKAVMFAKGVVFRRTHDLFELADQLDKAGFPPPIGAEELARITPYAVECRYGEETMPGPSTDEVTAMLATLSTWANSQVA